MTRSRAGDHSTICTPGYGASPLAVQPKPSAEALCANALRTARANPSQHKQQA